MYNDREEFDSVAWDRNDEGWEEAQKQLRLPSTCRRVESLIQQKDRKIAILVPPVIFGGYNVLYRIRIEGTASDVMVRLPCPGLAQFPCEKSLSEVATAKFVEGNTTVPISKILFSGQDSDLGSFIVLQHLYTTISESTLENLYGKAATCLLQFYRHSFPCIGSLAEGNDGSFSVVRRPITQNMNNMLQLANIPPSALPPTSSTYTTTDQWYIALAEMHVAQLVFQHNDLVTPADDCRNKYVARQILLNLAKEEKLSTFGFKEDDWSAQSMFNSTNRSPTPEKSGSFRLWCDDFRPGNILLSGEEVAPAIDWEFAYAAPAQFALDPPWWLLLDTPEITSPFGLAQKMRESWETGRFWLNYVARKSWAFDCVYWKFLDEKLFGERGNDILKKDLWKARINLLSDEERRGIEPFVERKMEQIEERVLVEWHEEDAMKELRKILFH
ncbi:phosphotransferase [Tricladium varicosporioides]|nr:phosphotransferase [Hymenoscyphus varicosporioides]